MNIEEIIKENQLIQDAYLTSIRDEQWGEMGILLYESTARSELTTEDLQSFLKGKVLVSTGCPNFLITT